MKVMGAFHSTKNSEIFETATNGTEMSRESWQTIQKLLNFRIKRITEPKIPGGKSNVTEIPGKKFPKIWV